MLEGRALLIMLSIMARLGKKGAGRSSEGRTDGRRAGLGAWLFYSGALLVREGAGGDVNSRTGTYQSHSAKMYHCAGVG